MSAGAASGPANRPGPGPRHHAGFSRRIGELCERHFSVVLVVVVAGLIALAWMHRFVQDDAFIAFRYADHLVRGQGLVYNPGERVEGYTCFLYVLMVAAGMRMGFDPIAVSTAIGLASFAGTLWATSGLARLLTGSRLAALATLVLLGLNFTFSAFATGGLETQLQTFLAMTCLLLGSAELLGRPAGAPAGATSAAVSATATAPAPSPAPSPAPDPLRFAAFSVVGALAILTRLDSLLLILPMGVALAWRTLAGAPRSPARARAAAALLLPGALMLGAWTVWKLGYYGSIVPNTFYVKVASRASLFQGFYYLYRFVMTYWLAVPLAFAAWTWRETAAGGRADRPVLAAALLWIAYVVAVGGDFMEFRLFVPVLPLTAILLVRVARLLERRAGLGLALVAVLLLGSLQHAIVYNHTSHRDGIESVWHMKSHLWSEEQNWIGIGKALRRDFEGDSSVVIALTAAGAIPYYSRAFTIDMLGLNDRWIARHGLTRRAAPGHQRIPTLDYLLERRVTLMLGHPKLVWGETPGPVDVQDYPVPHYVAGEAEGRTFPAGLKAIEIPIDRGYRLLVLYLTPNATVDRAIREGGWRVRDVVDRGAPAS